MPIHLRPQTIRRLRKTVQALAMLLFFYLFVYATFLNAQAGPADLFYRLNPLVAITAMLAGRVFIAGLALSFVTVVLTLIFGRVWCGWFCPMGTTLDIFSPRRKNRKTQPAPAAGWRRVKYILLAFLLLAALFGNQSLLFLDPITIMTRTLANAVWPALRSAVYSLEAFLYGFDGLWGPLDIIHQAVIYPLFKDVQSVYTLAVPVFLFFAGIVALNWVAQRFWCRYLCPLGGLLGLLARFALLRRVTDAGCTSCAACTHRCPTGTIQPEDGFSSDPAECTMCTDCLSACTRSSTAFRWHLPFGAGKQARWLPAPRQAYDPSRREMLGTLGMAAMWTALAGVEPIRKQQPADMVRPPGAAGIDFEALCIRCSECVRVCPTQGLQASFLEGGWQNMLTPRLVSRLGYCSYNCNACGQVCPSGAIPNLSLEEKRLVPIGLARVDRNRCLPWAYNIDCIVCEEACPVSNKAIRLEVVEVQNGSGETVKIQRPYVIKELCTGCGTCEYQCPMGGEAAIHIFAPTEAGGFWGGVPERFRTGPESE
jgi:MauM/NapG family ferredoxin protein